MKLLKLVPKWLCVLVLAAVLFNPALSQEADDPFAGVTIETLGSIAPDDMPGQALVLLRLTLEPGASIAAHGHPGVVVLFVESGTFGTEFTRGEGTITRAAQAGEPTTEQAGMGAEQLLEPGDSVAYGETAAHTMRNAGDEPLVLLVSALLSTDDPGFLFEGEHAH